MKRRHKYGAVPTVVDGIRFASKAEAKRYAELMTLLGAGEICGLNWQVPLTLSVYSGGGEIDIGKYVADFSYMDRRTKKMVFEDVKGFRTDLYRWKKKHAEAQYGIKIVEIGRASVRKDAA